MLQPAAFLAIAIAVAPQQAPPVATPPHPLDEVVVEAPPGTEGRAVLSCAVLRSGRMSDCRIESEEPPGRGFGEEALRAARNARIERGARPEGARVTFTVHFWMDD